MNRITHPRGGAAAERSRILIVDDDKKYCENLAAYLVLYGYEVSSVSTVAELDSLIAAHQPDLVLLDQRLGATTGTEVLRSLRQWSDVPCIVVTGMPDSTDRVVNLEVGADDEVDKTTPTRELLARIRAVLRRSAKTSVAPAEPESPAEPGSENPLDGWVLSRRLRELRRPDGSLCHLTTAEFETFLILHQAAGKPVRRAIICERVFGRPYRPGDRSVDNVVTKLRQKLEPGTESRAIKTLRPMGYIFTGFPRVEN